MANNLVDKSADLPGSDKFNAVQQILEHNKLLIHEINANHAARTPDSLSRNVILIRELNSNMVKVVDLYGELSHEFTAEQLDLKAELKMAGGGGGGLG